MALRPRTALQQLNQRMTDRLRQNCRSPRQLCGWHSSSNLSPKQQSKNCLQWAQNGACPEISINRPNGLIANLYGPVGKC